MTPEQLEEIQGIGPQAIEEIQQAVNAYYSQFEEGQGVENPEQNLPEATPEAAEFNASEEELAEVQGTDTHSLDTEPGPAGMPEEITATNYPPGTLYDPESPEERFEPGSEAEEAESEERAESATIEDAGSPTDNPGEVPEEGAPDESAQSGDQADRG
jgi:hypothetical protein